MATKFEKEHRAFVEFRKNLAVRDAAKESIKQAKATQEIAQETAKQTNLIRETEALKQQEILRKKEIEERISDIKKVVAKLSFKISDVDSLEGNQKAEEFFNINQEFKENVTKYREELVDLGEITSIEKLIELEKKLKSIRTSIYKNPKCYNYIQLKENSLELNNLIKEKETIKNKIVDLNNSIKSNISFKNMLEENYCNIFNISSEEFKNRIKENKIEFPKSGFLIVLIRRFFLASGFFLHLAFLTLINDPRFREIIPGIIPITVLTILVYFFVGRKTAAQRSKISKLESEYVKFKAYEEKEKNNSLYLEESNNFLKDITKRINSLETELAELKKKATQYGNNINEII